ncbi:sigma-70 family RNA polymerase sigma factor [Streptomyces olivaceus]|uniref:sigma-70 family RNA polymerase sigma factor n=1 Tax=Streptomyces olivaceus TaxID=47716 RepID=UPI001CCB8C83|nr:sigma-70 family RNA polymerase sigma factor [Streptomyces olivaceus]MBZ6204670.1 sigma-70 family RNA polymerase sigma factor [Streptomyces olivaceus]MBZ6212075.1 sigma-70 family RNA polymerase sigma factor [Streptomyces olivaceus]MBZ6288858.1 sigma-70 family RNA polymerase sigma factor [Streptomyces olivaceus]
MAQENLEGAAFNILRRHVQGALRRNGGAQAFTIEVSEEFRHQPGGVELSESALTEFRAALIELPERQRDVIVLRHLLGYSTEQTARCMGLSQDAVRFHDAKGRRRLDQYLSPS